MLEAILTKYLLKEYFGKTGLCNLRIPLLRNITRKWEGYQTVIIVSDWQQILK